MPYLHFLHVILCLTDFTDNYAVCKLFFFSQAPQTGKCTVATINKSKNLNPINTVLSSRGSFSGFGFGKHLTPVNN